jgi:hypothetical protein
VQRSAESSNDVARKRFAFAAMLISCAEQVHDTTSTCATHSLRCPAKIAAISTVERCTRQSERSQVRCKNFGKRCELCALQQKNCKNCCLRWYVSTHLYKIRVPPGVQLYTFSFASLRESELESTLTAAELIYTLGAEEQ